MKTKRLENRVRNAALATAIAFVGLILSLVATAIWEHLGKVFQFIPYVFCGWFIMLLTDFLALNIRKYWKGNGFWLNSFFLSAISFIVIFGGSLYLHLFLNQFWHSSVIIEKVCEISFWVSASFMVFSLITNCIMAKIKHRKEVRQVNAHLFYSLFEK